jgi:hypothetical protein
MFFLGSSEVLEIRVEGLQWPEVQQRLYRFRVQGL